MVVESTRQGLTVDDLRRAAARAHDARAARRMLAIALVLEGHSREDAAAACGLQPAPWAVPPGDRCAMDRQTLRDRAQARLCPWAHRYNEGGLAGLADLPRRNGPKPRLSPEQEATVAAWVEQGPDLERDGAVRWRCVDLQERIAREFGVSLHERTVGKLLHTLRFRRLSVRPQHPRRDPQAQAVFRVGLLVS